VEVLVVEDSGDHKQEVAVVVVDEGEDL